MPDDYKLSASVIEKDYYNYVYSILRPLRDTADLSETQFIGTEKKLIEVFESTLKYITTLLIAQYTEDNFNNPAINENIGKLKKPSLGMYAAIMRDIIKLYKSQGSSQGRWINRANEFFDDEVDDETFKHVRNLSDVLNYPTPKNAKNYKHLMDVLVTYRNKIAHEASKNEEEYAGYISSLFYVINSLVARLQDILTIPLVEVISATESDTGKIYKLKLWNGLLPKNEEERTDESLEIGHLYLKKNDPNKKFLDLLPFCCVFECSKCHTRQIFFLNKAKKREFEFLSYQCGHIIQIGPDNYAFNDIFSFLNRLQELDEEGGVPDHLLPSLIPTEESIIEFNKAQVLVSEKEPEEALSLLRHSLDKSPGYKDALTALVNILKEHKTRESLEEAHEALGEYLNLFPDNEELLLQDARILIEIKKPTEAGQRIRRILTMDPDNEEAKNLKEIVEAMSPEEESVQEEIEAEKSHVLFYDYLFKAVFGTYKRSRLFILLILSLFSLAEAVLFFVLNDILMGTTVLAMGILMVSIVLALYRIHRWISESYYNFSSFIKTKKGMSYRKFFCDQLEMIFGKFYVHENKSILGLMFKENRKRTIFICVSALIGALWIFSVTKYAVLSQWVDVTYGFFLFVFFLNFFYQVFCLVYYHKLLRHLRFQQIHFSLVQHPKLSIRYLSYLSRKISYPLLLIYILFSFVLYLGPLLSNLLYLIAFSLFVLFVFYMYYSTIFLIRKVIIQNKWRLIAKFSVHFDTPFDQLISRARIIDMNRLKELMEMRNFIDSIDVWAERKKTLFFTSLFYLLVILASTSGMSNLMTRVVVPKISQMAGTFEAYESSAVIADEVVGRDDSVDIRVSDVDDTVLAFWGDSEQDMIERNMALLDEVAVKMKDPEQKDALAVNLFRGRYFERCDWKNGVHGSMQVDLPVEGAEKHILIFAYNKVYHNIPLLGGGKLSYNIQVDLGRKNIYKTRQFIRINTKSMGLVTYIRIRKTAEGYEITSQVGRTKIREEFLEFVEKLNRILDEESDARVSI